MKKSDKKHTLSWWKKKAKKTFQRYVRLRDADHKGYCTCCTCGKRVHWKQANGGHFIPAEKLSTCFIEHNCHAQCVYCNKYLHGNLIAYFKFMESRYGRDEIDLLEVHKNTAAKYKFFDYQEIIEMYTDKINGLEIQMGLL